MSRLIVQRLVVATASIALVAGCGSAGTDSPIPTEQPSAPATTAPSASPIGSPSQSSAPAPVEVEAGIVQVLVDDLLVRAAPGADSEAVATLSAGQLVPVTGATEVVEGDSWVEVVQAPSGLTGWVAGIGPDGSPWLAVVHDGPIGVTAGQDAELVDPDTGERSPLTSGMHISDLAFAPDGESVAVIAPWEGSRIVPVDVVTAPEPTPAPTGPSFGPPVMAYPAFAPNGEVVAFLVGQNLLELSLISVGEGEPPAFPLPSTLRPLSWAPDSQRIAGSEWVNIGSEGPENWEIVVAEVGQSVPARLTNRDGIDVNPAWSPDGSSIAFLQDSGHGSAALAVMAADGSNMRTLLTFDGFPLAAAQPAWSPDGSRIAIVQQLEGYSAMVHLVDAETSEHLSISAPADRCDDLTWSPTGTRIAFVCGPADGSVIGTAFVATVGGNEVKELGRAAHLDWARTLEPIEGD